MTSSSRDSSRFWADMPGVSIFWVLFIGLVGGWPWILFSEHGHAWGWAAFGVVWDLPIALILLAAAGVRLPEHRDKA